MIFQQLIFMVIVFLIAFEKLGFLVEKVWLLLHFKKNNELDLNHAYLGNRAQLM
jgi:hypothetical protein